MAETWESVYEDDTHMQKPVDEHIQKTLTFVQEHEGSSDFYYFHIRVIFANLSRLVGSK